MSVASPAPAHPARSAAVLTVLGSGTLVPDGRRRSAAHHLAADGVSVLLDCGPGTVHGLDEHGIDWPALGHVVVSHFHNDHVGDLPALLLALRRGASPPRSAPLTLTGPPGLRRLLDGLSAALDTDLLDAAFPIEVVEVPRDGRRELAASGAAAPSEPARPSEPHEPPPVELRCAPTRHTEHSIAIVLAGRWGRVGYTGDTGPTPELGAFLAGCSVLVAECAHPDGAEADTHLTPSALAALAREAAPGLLVVTHVYAPRTPEIAAAEVAERFDGPTRAAVDGMRIRISAGRVTVDPPGSPL